MKFLIVRLGALGDIVHAVPVAVALRRAYPDSRIDWLVGAKHQDILNLVPALSRRIAVNDRGGDADGLSLSSAVGALRRARYDVAIDLQGLLKSAVLARLSGAARILGFTSRYAREAMASWFYTERYDPGGPGLFAAGETRHVARINLGMLSQLGVDVTEPTFEFDVPTSPAISDAVGRAGRRFALLNPGAAWPNKRWPPERFGTLAAALRERQGLASVVLWGPGEHTLAEAVVSAAGNAATLAPPTTVADIAALARAATVMVSGDTGPAHIASAMGTPLVGIYGPTRPERNGPLGRDDEAVSRATVCECHHRRQCRRPRMCLLDVDVQEVLDAVERRLAAGEGRHG